MISQPPQPLPPSGPAPGEPLAAFIVDDVTGKFPGERLCYVCHYGNGPVVLLFARSVDERLAHAASALGAWREMLPGAAAFVVVASADPEGDAEALHELAEAHSVAIPLTLCSEGEFGPHLYRLHPRVPVTAVLYRDKTVVRTLTASGLTPGFLEELLAAAAALAGDRSPRTPEDPFPSCRLPAAAGLNG